MIRRMDRSSSLAGGDYPIETFIRFEIIDVNGDFDDGLDAHCASCNFAAASAS